MTLGRKACEHLIDGHRVECVVGWASAPSDGMSADDLVYAAESGRSEHGSVPAGGGSASTGAREDARGGRIALQPRV